MSCLGPEPPDPAQSYIAGIEADLETLPARRIIEAAAMLGQRVTVNIPGQGLQTFDFTGLGEADYQAQFGDQMAQELLAIQREFGPQYVEQRLAELELADPEGAAMRRRLWSSIQEDLTRQGEGLESARELEALILGELERGGELDDQSRDRVIQQVRGGQVGRGNWLGNAPAVQEGAALTSASEQARAIRQQQALSFLEAGISPTDVRLREEQQGLSNLGAFVSGETPQAQFGQLSGAQAGAAPFTFAQNLTGADPQAGQAGINFANNFFSQQQALNQATVNPWIAGVQGAIGGVNLWSALGGSLAPTGPGVTPQVSRGYMTGNVGWE